MTQITYSNKSDITTTATPNVNKVLASDLNEIKSVVNQNDTLLSNITGNILWTNPNPTNDFSGQNIILSSDDYDVLEWYYRNDVPSNLCFSQQILKGYGTQLDFLSTASGSRQWSRRIIRNSDTSFTCWDCVKVDGSSTTNDNGLCVPLYVIGYKTGLF